MANPQKLGMTDGQLSRFKAGRHEGRANRPLDEDMEALLDDVENQVIDYAEFKRRLHEINQSQ
jgi:hypothetical protein